MWTLTDKNADTSTMREMDLDLPDGAEVILTLTKTDSQEQITFSVTQIVSHIKIIMPNTDG